MCIYVPQYYNEFKCSAGACKHNCCIGWEIDIDNKTLADYMNVSSQYGEKLKSGIVFDIDTAHFKLCENERCQFLNDDNLCDIHINLGENMLCEICREHPRFRNFFTNREEIGLGMCCEEAARLILSQTALFELVPLDMTEKEKTTPEEEVFLAYRDYIISIAQDREYKIDDRLNQLSELSGIKFPEKDMEEWHEIYIKLETLDKNWYDILKLLKLSNGDCRNIPEYTDVVFEQLLVYFIYRHFAEAIYDSMIGERIMFSVLSVFIIRCICSGFIIENGRIDFETILQISRMYSTEIEYSQENSDSLTELFKD